MGSAARFRAEFFPLLLLGALSSMLMEDSRSTAIIPNLTTEPLAPYRGGCCGARRRLVTDGGVRLFVAFFVLAPPSLLPVRAPVIPAG